MSRIHRTLPAPGTRIGIAYSGGLDTRTAVAWLARNGLEVFAYTAPDQREAMPRNSDVGGHHVALYVDDLEAAVEHLRGAGVQVLDGPTASKGPAEGNRWIYFLSPWGMQFELVSYPHGKAFDADPSAFD